eukprot:INCI2745.1.p1 GENE.INCI2745.1~~INCI2745.1.p1  ORF type:complete len:382 (+),score=52.80 INCI2745.1:98-1243(+)
MLRNYAAASAAVLKFYLSMIFRFGEIHPDIPSGRLLGGILHLPKVQTTPATFRLRKKFRSDFNDAYDDLRRTLRTELAGVADIPFERTLFLSFAVRAVWVLLCVLGLTFTNDDSQFAFAPRVFLLLAGLLQFFVAPMSLVVCVMRLGTNLLDFLVHYLCNAVAAGLVAFATGGAGSRLSLSLFDARVAAGFLALDFLANLAVYWRVSEPFGFWRLLKHIVYGTLNTKTYFLVVFALLNGLRVDAAVFLLTSVMSYFVYSKGIFVKTLSLLGLPSFPILFYCEHRINHCPVVYAHAHKMHHYLHDTTAFDGHIYGSGMNEEFLWIVAEVLPCLLATAICGPEVAAAGLGLFPFFPKPRDVVCFMDEQGGSFTHVRRWGWQLG